VERSPMISAAPLSSMLKGGLQSLRGNTDSAIESFRDAADGCDRLDMFLNSAAIRFQLGKLLGGGKGTELVTTAEQQLRELGIVAPERFARMLVPFRYN